MRKRHADWIYSLYVVFHYIYIVENIFTEILRVNLYRIDRQNKTSQNKKLQAITFKFG